MAVRATGFPDTVIWNPSAASTHALADLGPGGERGMLCVEAAAAAATDRTGRRRGMARHPIADRTLKSSARIAESTRGPIRASGR